MKLAVRVLQTLDARIEPRKKLLIEDEATRKEVSWSFRRGKGFLIRRTARVVSCSRRTITSPKTTRWTRRKREAQERHVLRHRAGGQHHAALRDEPAAARHRRDSEEDFPVVTRHMTCARTCISPSRKTPQEHRPRRLRGVLPRKEPPLIGRKAERFVLHHEELRKRNKVTWTSSWLKDNALEESANLPVPKIIAATLAAELEPIRDNQTRILRVGSCSVLHAIFEDSH